MKKTFVFVLAVVLSSVVYAENELSGKVVSVVDGNTIELLSDDNESYMIMLYGIDSPELGQEFGHKAQKFLQKIALDKKVNVKIQGNDRWGNRLGIILIEGKIDLRLEVLEAGLAWTPERNPIVRLESVNEKDREKGKGL